jgi:large repetitive protein
MKLFARLFIALLVFQGALISSARAQNDLIITPSDPWLAQGILNDEWEQDFDATGGQPPYTWKVSRQPNNLTMNATTGELSGITLEVGTFHPIITVKDANGLETFRDYTMVVKDEPFITNKSPLPDGFTFTAYNQTLLGKNGIQPYLFSVTGSLPPGLSLSPDGFFSGTPTNPGTYRFSVKISDSSSPVKSSSKTFDLSILDIQLSPTILPGGNQGSNYPLPANEGETTITASRGTPPYTFVVAEGKLPSGIGWTTTANTITFSGFPRVGTGSFILYVKDSKGKEGRQAYSFTIGSPLAPAISTNPTLPTGVVGRDYSFQFAGTGAAPLVWSVVDFRGLPPGLSFGPNGVLSGRPTTVGTYSFSVTVRDNNRNTTTQAVTIAISTSPIITTSSPMLEATVGLPYPATVLGAIGGLPPYTWSAISGLPSGLSFDAATATISGTPTSPGSAMFSAVVTDSNSTSTNKTLSLAVLPAPLDQWKAKAFSLSQLSDPTISGNDADPDSDGLSNLLEYALGGGPWANDSGLVGPSIGTNPSGFLQVSFSVDDSLSDITYITEKSADLSLWESVATSTGGSPFVVTSPDVTVDDPGTGIRTVVITSTVPGGGCCFFRLRITSP